MFYAAICGFLQYLVVIFLMKDCVWQIERKVRKIRVRYRLKNHALEAKSIPWNEEGF
jgi:hypothetical protein